MFKFGMSDYEVNQNIIGVAIANFMVYGFLAGAAVAGIAVGLLFLIF